MGTDGYQIRYFVTLGWGNHSKDGSKIGPVLNQPNEKQSKVLDNTHTLSRVIATFNIRYVAYGLDLV